MYTLLKPLLAREELLKKNIHIFTVQDFERIFQISPNKAKYFLEEQVKKGLLLRLKKGLYTLRTDLPDEKEIANALYKPSYISFAYALAYYNILPEMPYSITCATTKPTRLFTLNNQVFNYYTIKTEAYTGYVIEKKGNKTFLIAEAEKALVDYLYFISLGRQFPHERLDVSKLNKNKGLKYAALYKRANLFKLVKEIL